MSRVIAVALLLLLPGLAGAQEHRTKRWPAPPSTVRGWLSRQAERAPATRRAVVGTARTLADPQFATAIVLADLAKAGLAGDRDRAREALLAPDRYEFWSNVAIFGGTAAASEAALVRLTRGLPAAGGATKLLRSNLVLALALTAGQCVEVDFGGKRLSDLAHGELPDLSQIRIRIRGDVDAGGLAITLGAFAVAQPLWTQVTTRIGRLLKLPAVRGRWAGRGLRVLDLAALLVIAHELEEPARDAYRRWLSTQALEAAIKDLNALFARTTAPTTAELDEALGDVARAFANHRDFLYVLPAVADVDFLRRARERGEREERLAAVEARTLERHGDWLALPGQTLELLEHYRGRLARGDVPGGDVAAFGALYGRHVSRVQTLVRRIVNAQRLPADPSVNALARMRLMPALRHTLEVRFGSLDAWQRSHAHEKDTFDPTGPAFEVSRSRAELYLQEAALYRLLEARASTPEVKERLRTEADAVTALGGTEGELLRAILAVPPYGQGAVGVVADLDDPEAWAE